ncbi:MAG TPA: SMI1/KNR4 family protein, partial [Chitinophagaceae bacterium]|nr:SMI1/KNR4 family protein [Chitinophagaceae bacterium]
MPQEIFKDIDFSDFWDDSEYSLTQYVSEQPTDELIKSIENELGYKLPASYVELMKMHNGGIPKNVCFPTSESTSWAADHIAITGILGIGKEKTYSLCGDLGSQFMIDEWGYPAIGVYICDCPSAGHDIVMLDYSKCGKQGEPEVVYIDQESDCKKTFLAKDFETFIRGLVNEEVYDTSAQDLINSLETFKTGDFSDILQGYFKK